MFSTFQISPTSFARVLRFSTSYSSSTQNCVRPNQGSGDIIIGPNVGQRGCATSVCDFQKWKKKSSKSQGGALVWHFIDAGTQLCHWVLGFLSLVTRFCCLNQFLTVVRLMGYNYKPDSILCLLRFLLGHNVPQRAANEAYLAASFSVLLTLLTRVQLEMPYSKMLILSTNSMKINRGEILLFCDHLREDKTWKYSWVSMKCFKKTFLIFLRMHLKYIPFLQRLENNSTLIGLELSAFWRLRPEDRHGIDLAWLVLNGEWLTIFKEIQTIFC